MTGSELRRAREAAGLSKRALARLAGITPKAVRYHERKAMLDLRGHAVGRMAEALGGEFLEQSTRARAALLARWHTK